MVVIKLVIFLVLMYFVAKSARNLFRAVLNDPKAPPRVPPHAQQSRTTPWQGPSPERSPRKGPDIEDARWVDL